MIEMELRNGAMKELKNWGIPAPLKAIAVDSVSVLDLPVAAATHQPQIR
jgi:hypothetical protein